MCVFVSEYFVHSVVILLLRQLGYILKEDPVRLISFTPSLRFRAGAQVALSLNWAGVPWAVARFAVFCSKLQCFQLTQLPPTVLLYSEARLNCCVFY